MNKPGDSLLSELILFRDDLRLAHKDMPPAADPTGDARLAIKIVTDRLTAIINRHGDEAKPK